MDERLGRFFYGPSYFCYAGTLRAQLIRQIGVALWEELLWRFIPFTICYLLWHATTGLKTARKLILPGIIVAIVLIQIKFGLAHTLTDSDLRILLGQAPKPSFYEYLSHAVIQGGMGLLLCFVYLKYLLEGGNFWRYVQIKPYLATSFIHMAANQIIVYDIMH